MLRQGKRLHRNVPANANNRVQTRATYLEEATRRCYAKQNATLYNKQAAECRTHHHHDASVDLVPRVFARVARQPVVCPEEALPLHGNVIAGKGLEHYRRGGGEHLQNRQQTEYICSRYVPLSALRRCYFRLATAASSEMKWRGLGSRQSAAAMDCCCVPKTTRNRSYRRELRLFLSAAVYFLPPSARGKQHNDFPLDRREKHVVLYCTK